LTLAIDVFIVCYLLVIAFGHAPAGRLPGQLFVPFRVIIDAIGLRQFWAMFAPDPAAASTSLFVLIHLRSGRAIRWEREPHGSFRRRLFVLMLATVGGSLARHSFAGYLIRTYCGADDPPVSVTFMRTLTPVAPWPGATSPHDQLVECVQVADLDDLAGHSR